MSVFVYIFRRMVCSKDDKEIPTCTGISHEKQFQNISLNIQNIEDNIYIIK